MTGFDFARRRFRPGCALLALTLSAAVSAFGADEARPVRVVALPGGASLQFVWVPPGIFQRGSNPAEAGRDADEGPRHAVTLSRGFFLGVHEITQAQWTAVMGGNPAVFRHGAEAPRRPVESVSWDDCQMFIARLAEIGAGRFRLPTEAEWEYAARAGSETCFPWGDDPSGFSTHQHAWANSRSMALTHPVGEKPPNAWGLHDMHGNVWEWCADWYGPYAGEAQRDPPGPAAGTEKIFRGGSWFDFPPSLRSANRHRHRPDGKYAAVGLRLVWEAEAGP
ncbi:MAG: formylglycine-generating enzyme family protein [Opitutaceae bacterium]